MARCGERLDGRAACRCGGVVWRRRGWSSFQWWCCATSLCKALASYSALGDLGRDQFYASAWRPALVGIGLDPDRFVFHVLRHFCASSLLVEGAPLVARRPRRPEPLPGL